MIRSQRDIEVIDIKDYITKPKPNGYRSLHLILKIPVFMSDRGESVYVEVQIRTIAMDFWASQEHKIYYKYNQEVPKELLFELKEAAKTASDLDKKMEDVHKKVTVIKQDKVPIESDILNVLNGVSIPQMTHLLKGLLNEDKNTL